MSDFSKILQKVEKAASKDPNMSIYQAGDLRLSSRAPYGIPSGLPELDFSLGKPGIPAGKLTEYFGFEKSGKTAASFHVLASAQRMGGGGLFIDTEMSWDRGRAEDCGVDTEVNFAVGEADTIEGTFRQLEAACQGLEESGWNKPFVAVVDSITGVQSETNKNKEIGEEPRVGEDARIIRHALRRLIPEFSKTKMTVILINHAIKTVNSSPWAEQSTSAGGHAIKFFSALRVQFSHGADIKDKDKSRLGQKSFLKIKKLKGSPLVYSDIECQLLNKGGFNYNLSLLNACLRSGLVSKPSGSRIYTLNLGEEEVKFEIGEWEEILAGLGGPHKFYDQWINWCMEKRLITKWNEF